MNNQNDLQNTPLPPPPPEKHKVTITFQLHLNHVLYSFNVASVQHTTALKPILTDINTSLSLNLCSRLRLKCDDTRTKTTFRLSAKRTSPFKSAWASVQSTTGSRGVRISGSNAECTMFRGSVKGTGYPLHSLVSPSLPLPCVTVCHHISTGL
jgi:hypothetical protein